MTSCESLTSRSGAGTFPPPVTRRSALTPDQQQVVRKLYAGQPLTSERLPYTSEIGIMVRDFNARTGCEITEKQMFDELTRQRKDRMLPCKAR